MHRGSSRGLSGDILVFSRLSSAHKDVQSSKRRVIAAKTMCSTLEMRRRGRASEKAQKHPFAQRGDSTCGSSSRASAIAALLTPLLHNICLARSMFGSISVCFFECIRPRPDRDRSRIYKILKVVKGEYAHKKTSAMDSGSSIPRENR